MVSSNGWFVLKLASVLMSKFAVRYTGSHPEIK
jgi:hypothetical protein